MNTERIILREWTSQLLEELLVLAPKDQLTFLGYDSLERLNKEVEKYKQRSAACYVLIKKWDLLEKTTLKTMGSCGFHNWYPEHDRAELGYFLEEEYRGLGIMSEALQKVVNYGFNDLKLNRIEAFISPKNYASLKIIQDLGFTKEGVLRQHYKTEEAIHDSLVYSLLKSEYSK